MEKEELKRLHELKNDEKYAKMIENKKKIKKIVIFFLIAVVLCAILVLSVFKLVKPIQEEKKFSDNMKIVYEKVIEEKAKKASDPYYEYIGRDCLDYSGQYSNQYEEIEEILQVELNEDYYILTPEEQKILNVEGINDVYLINYQKEVVFNLNPISSNKKKIYVIDEILNRYQEIKDNDESEANKPMLFKGMTPVKYNEVTNKWEITTEDDKFWYNYDNKKWANVILSDYKDDISEASMFVWIPRYAYRISKDNYNTSSVGIIDIRFLKDNSNIDKYGNNISGTNTDSSKDFVIHPAFKFEEDITGIWVSKYEASSLENGLDGTQYGGDNDENKTYKSVANRYSWMNADVNTIFNISKNISKNEIYGLDESQVDTHLMKNTDWGAVAYLTQSKYGRNKKEVTINNYYEISNVNNKIKTGYAGRNAIEGTPSTNPTITFLWDTLNGVKASTTGNVYGIYDLSGGANERVAAYIDNGASSLKEYGLSLYLAEDKYKNVYYVDESNVYNSFKKYYGDAIFETSKQGDYSNSWFGDLSEIIISREYVFFYRGGMSNMGKNAGLYYYTRSSGGTYTFAGFRAVITQTTK